MALKQRTTSVPIHNRGTNLVGEILSREENQGKQLQIAQVHSLVCDECGDRYTPGQVKVGLEWQAENNSYFIKTWLRPYNNGAGKISSNTRFYWYEPVTVVSADG